jgi:hypothetical protein
MIFYTKLDAAEINLNLQLRLLTPTPVFSFPNSPGNIFQCGLSRMTSHSTSPPFATQVRIREKVPSTCRLLQHLRNNFFFTNHSFPVPYTFVEIYEASRTKKTFFVTWNPPVPQLFSSRTFLIKVCRITSSCCLLFRRVAEKT